MRYLPIVSSACITLNLHNSSRSMCGDYRISKRSQHYHAACWPVLSKHGKQESQMKRKNEIVQYLAHIQGRFQLIYDSCFPNFYTTSFILISYQLYSERMFLFTCTLINACQALSNEDCKNICNIRQHLCGHHQMQTTQIQI